MEKTEADRGGVGLTDLPGMTLMLHTRRNAVYGRIGRLSECTMECDSAQALAFSR
jgi:hypothetical protein